MFALLRGGKSEVCVLERIFCASGLVGFPTRTGRLSCGVRGLSKLQGAGPPFFSVGGTELP